MTEQLDLIRHGDQAMARAHLVAAETALHNPYFTPEQQRERHAHYLAEARRFDPSIPLEVTP